MSRHTAGEKMETKRDILLKMIAISGELPSYLTGIVVGSPSYAASLVTALKKDGYIHIRSKDGVRGYILSKKGKTYLLNHYETDMRDYLTGASETNHVKSEKEKRLRLHRMSLAWTHFFLQGCIIFSSEKPEIFSESFFRQKETGTYYGSQELKGGTDKIKGSRACGLFIKKGEAFVVYQTMENLMKWAKKTEHAMRAWVEGKALRHNLSWGSDAIFLGNSMAFLLQILESTGGIKNQLFQVDETYEHYYYIPCFSTPSFIQTDLIVDGKATKHFKKFLYTMLDEVEDREFSVHAGYQKQRRVYFCYEMELKHLIQVKMELERKGNGVVVCLDYQAETLKEYFGEEVEMMVLVCEKVKQYLDMQRS